MLKRLKAKLTYANVMVTILAVLVVGGSGAYAATKLGNNAVKTKNLKNNAVKTAKIADGAVTTPKIANDAVTGEKANEATFSKVPSATAADKVGTVVTADVDIPNFGAGNNQCNTDTVTVPGVAQGDTVVMTPAGDITWTGNTQASITLHRVEAGEVDVMGCLSADATTPVDPTPTPYRFLIIK
jgi:hypothetical protein